MEINSFFANKKTFLLIVGLILVLTLLFILRILFYSPPSSIAPSSTSLQVSSREPSPTVLQGLPSSFPTPSASTSAKPIIYQISTLNQDYLRITNRQILSAADQEVKSKLTASLNGSSGLIGKSADFSAEYDKTPDVFMVQLLNINISKAKKSAEAYFTNAGLSQSGICNLPVVFYLSQEVKDALIKTNQSFNPVPDGC